jgi:hypothetical protein
LNEVGTGPATAIAVATVRERLSASGIAVDDSQAQEVLAFSKEPEVGSFYRGLPLGELEPMLAFYPRWRA